MLEDILNMDDTAHVTGVTTRSTYRRQHDGHSPLRRKHAHDTPATLSNVCTHNMPQAAPPRELGLTRVQYAREPLIYTRRDGNTAQHV